MTILLRESLHLGRFSKRFGQIKNGPFQHVQKQTASVILSTIVFYFDSIDHFDNGSQIGNKKNTPMYHRCTVRRGRVKTFSSHNPIEIMFEDKLLARWNGTHHSSMTYEKDHKSRKFFYLWIIAVCSDSLLFMAEEEEKPYHMQLSSNYERSCHLYLNIDDDQSYHSHPRLLLGFILIKNLLELM